MAVCGIGPAAAGSRSRRRGPGRRSTARRCRWRPQGRTWARRGSRSSPAGRGPPRAPVPRRPTGRSRSGALRSHSPAGRSDGLAVGCDLGRGRHGVEGGRSQTGHEHQRAEDSPPRSHPSAARQGCRGGRGPSRTPSSPRSCSRPSRSRSRRPSSTTRTSTARSARAGRSRRRRGERAAGLLDVGSILSEASRRRACRPVQVVHAQEAQMAGRGRLDRADRRPCRRGVVVHPPCPQSVPEVVGEEEVELAGRPVVADRGEQRVRTACRHLDPGDGTFGVARQADHGGGALRDEGEAVDVPGRRQLRRTSRRDGGDVDPLADAERMLGISGPRCCPPGRRHRLAMGCDLSRSRQGVEGGHGEPEHQRAEVAPAESSSLRCRQPGPPT